MGLILVDTSVLIDNLRGVPKAGEALDAAAEAGDHLAASVVTKVELLAGMRATEKSATRRLMASLNWVAVTDEIAGSAGELARAYRGSHQGVGVVDFLIAATVEHVGARLWTLNVRHFPMFPGLAAPY